MCLNENRVLFQMKYKFTIARAKYRMYILYACRQFTAALIVVVLKCQTCDDIRKIVIASNVHIEVNEF